MPETIWNNFAINKMENTNSLKDALMRANERAERFRIALSKRDMQIETCEADLEELNLELMRLKQSKEQQDKETQCLKEQDSTASIDSTIALNFESQLDDKIAIIKSLTDELESLHEGYQDMDTEILEYKAKETQHLESEKNMKQRIQELEDYSKFILLLMADVV
jgi:chromosome segregation ATPase